MKFDIRSIVATASVASMLFLSACDWSSGSQENFNTSGGSSNTNVSGLYTGPTVPPDPLDPSASATTGPVVTGASNNSIRRLMIQQSGNRLNIVDDNGSVYEGTLGSPEHAENPQANLQVGFSGRDKVTNFEIEFTGVFNGDTLSGIWIEVGGRVGQLSASR